MQKEKILLLKDIFLILKDSVLLQLEINLMQKEELQEVSILYFLGQKMQLFILLAEKLKLVSMFFERKYIQELELIPILT
jgi:hypothetical protein